MSFKPHGRLTTQTLAFSLKVILFLFFSECMLCFFVFFLMYLWLRTVILKSHFHTVWSLFVPFLKVWIAESDHQFKKKQRKKLWNGQLITETPSSQRQEQCNRFKKVWPMDFMLFLLFRNFLQQRFKFAVKVNALPCLTVRWHCGTHNCQINTLLCVRACHLLCWPYIQYLLGVRWFLYQAEICSVIILITRWKLSLSAEYFWSMQQHANMDSKNQTSVPQSHLSLSANLSKSYFYHSVILCQRFSQRSFSLTNRHCVKLQHSSSETLQMRIDCVHFFNLNISCSLVLKNWKKTFLTSWMCPSLRFCPVTHVKGIY